MLLTFVGLGFTDCRGEDWPDTTARVATVLMPNSGPSAADVTGSTTGGASKPAPTPAPVTFSIGGTLSGLAAGQQVTLLNQAGGALTVKANGAFTAASVAAGGSYRVTVGTAPLNQSCVITNGSGSASSSDIASVTVTCTTYPNCARVSPETCGLFHAMTAGINITSIYSAGTYGSIRLNDALVADLCKRFDTFRLMLPFFDQATGSVNNALVAASRKAAEKFVACGASVIVTNAGLPTSAAWTDAPEPRLNELWTKIGRAFQGASKKILFELLNEPGLANDSTRLNTAMHGMLAALRATGVQNTAILSPQGASEAGYLSGVRFPADRNVIYTIHQYAPFNFTHQGAWWPSTIRPSGVTCCDAAQIATIESVLATANNWAKRTGYPLVIGEFGSTICSDQNSRKNSLRENLSRAKQWDMAPVLWSYDEAFGIFEKTTLTWDPVLLPLIQKPSAGEPAAGFLSYSGTKHCR